jgi:hypothetical protein
MSKRITPFMLYSFGVKKYMNCEIELHIAMWAPSENRPGFAGGPYIVPNMPISAGQMGPRAGGPTKP